MLALFGIKNSWHTEVHFIGTVAKSNDNSFNSNNNILPCFPLSSYNSDLVVPPIPPLEQAHHATKVQKYQCDKAHFKVRNTPTCQRADMSLLSWMHSPFYLAWKVEMEMLCCIWMVYNAFLIAACFQIWSHQVNGSSHYTTLWSLNLGKLLSRANR